MKTLLTALAGAAALAMAAAVPAEAAETDKTDVLIFTRWRYVKDQKTGEVRKDGFGPKSRPFHHHSTEQGAEEVRRYFTANGLKCKVTDDPAFFTSPAMKDLRLVFLCNTNHELFDTPAQREAFYKFVENGGGLVATHSASANERGSERFRKFLGGAFERHYVINQPVPFNRIDRSHPAMACIPEGYVWERDEVYLNNPMSDVRPLLILDWKDVHPQSRKSDSHGCPEIGGHVLVWCKNYGKGRIFYTALGHFPKDWGKMEFQLHLLQAARWAMGELPDAVGGKSAKAQARATIDGAECVRDGKTVWKFEIANRESKPFIHPLCLPDGRCITDCRPKDHPWHLGLWFCWKYINGKNYWEPRDPAQSNLFPDGATIVKDFKISPAGGACRVDLALWYGPRAEPGKVLLEEKRTVSFTEPDGAGRYKIRSTHEFTARAAVRLDCRRPVGYGGLSCRMAPFVSGFKAEGTGGAPDPARNIAAPKSMTAVRYVDPASGHGIEIKMLSPLPGERIYTWSDHRFANPMPIYDGPLDLKPGESFKLDYEISIF